MKKPIEQHIFEILKHNDCVIITGLGGFVLNYKPAYINEINNTIYPPSKSISFNSKLTDNDGLLANYLMTVEDIGYNEACVEILKFSQKSKLKLKRHQVIHFKNVGELYENKSGNIEFQPNTSLNFNTKAYGLSSFQISKLKKEPKASNYNLASAAAILILICLSIFSLTNERIDNLLVFDLNPINNNNYQPRPTFENKNDRLGKETPGIYNVQVSQVDFDLYKINGTNYHIATKKCFKLGFGRDVQIKIWKDEKDRTQRQVCFLNVSETEYDDCYKIIEVYSELVSQSDKVMVLTKRGRMREATLVLEETYIDPYIIANSNPEEELEDNSQEIELDENVGKRFINAIHSLSTPEKKTIENDISTPSSENIQLNRKKIHIIVGSFSDLNNAQALSKQLKTRGFTNAQIIEKNENGLIRVSVDSFFTEEEAHAILGNVKKQLSSAWILNQN
ncbi:MAG: hypothetical protein CMD27_02720 [Flavobacteriales bacterium]|nr:hypothetical protein [Flavobacteriales bacterium]|tara:strand:+ start:1841 stop:3190 length:1350 start_codon:yes stop_codon:yes gene_type:complete